MPEAVRGTLLAFDFGEKRIGVATGETLLGSAHPLTTIHAESNDDRFAAIGKLIAEWQPEHLVVGLPTYKNSRTIGAVMTAIADGIVQYSPNGRGLICVADGGSSRTRSAVPPLPSTATCTGATRRRPAANEAAKNTIASASVTMVAYTNALLASASCRLVTGAPL